MDHQSTRYGQALNAELGSLLIPSHTTNPHRTPGRLAWIDVGPLGQRPVGPDR